MVLIDIDLWLKNQDIYFIYVGILYSKERLNEVLKDKSETKNNAICF